MILSIGKAVEEGYESVRMNADKITSPFYLKVVILSAFMRTDS